MTKINRDNIADFLNTDVFYKTIKNGNIRKYTLKSIDREEDEYSTLKVIDKSDDSKTGDKELMRSLRYANITN
tara:strand:+ start:418 stop:636 length:219 start_codon:yes stop_codon:yes gene_type:complete